jgi:hypothetical protein
MYHILASSKGGVGKSTISTIIAGYFVTRTGAKIKLIEADDNNETAQTLKDSQFVQSISFDVANGIDNMQEALFDVFDDQDIIIDAGGGNDSLKVVKAIGGLGVEDKIVFYIPLLRNKAGMKNVLDMYKLIRSFGNSKIVFILNKCLSCDEKSIENEFKYFFGNEKFAIDGIAKEVLSDDNTAILMIEDSDVFDFAEDYSQPVWEIANTVIDKQELYAQAKPQGKEALKKAIGFVNIHNECVSFTDKCLLDAYFRLDEFLDLGI